MSNKDLFQRVKKLNLPIGKYALFGSAPMGIRGLKECHDIDMVVDEDLWQEYKNKAGWQYKITEHGVEHIESDDGDFEIWHDWRPWYQEIDWLINEAEIIDDLPFVKLKYVIDWKRQYGREKDLKDIKIIEKFLQTQQ